MSTARFGAKNRRSGYGPSPGQTLPPVELYDTAEGRYVSVEELREWRRDGIAFTVEDAETGEDVTLALLA